MSLANLSINIIANTGAAVGNIRDFSATAQHHFQRSVDAVDGFRTHVQRTSDALASAATQMGGNMQAANDAIVASTAKSEAAVEQLSATVEAVDFKTFSERAVYAFGQGFGTGYAVAQTWLQKTEDYVVAKGKVIAIGVAIAAVSATAGVVYGAYRIISGTLGFINGLFTGESYKAASIDELIKLNGEVKALQANLHISAQEAGALLDATARLGVDKADYTAAYAGATTAMRANGDELDRLGIKYKAQNGQILSQAAFLQNVKTALDEYTVGWDRNQAAAAIGAGTYQQITDALKITQPELEASKARMDEYGLSIGPNTQAAVALYEQAMRDFNNETRLTGQGFARVFADSIMPALTDLANFFKDGWPKAVGAFRIGMGTMTGLFYALKDGVYIVAESILGSVHSIGLALSGLGTAFAKALTGDFSGAKEALLGGLVDAQNRFMQIGSNIVAQVMHNDAAIKMALGQDDRQDSLATAAGKVGGKTGKAWAPKPKDEPKPTAAPASAYQTYLNELDRTLKKLQENEYAAMRLKAEQLAQKEGITDLAAAYQKINDIQRQDSQRVVDELTRKLGEESAAYAFQTGLLGLTALQQDKLTFSMQKRLELEQLIASAKRSGKPLDDQAIADLQRQTDATIALGQAQRDQRDATARSAATGMQTALNAYQDAASNAAKQTEGMITGGLQRMEDAIVSFAHTGKLSFSSLFRFMADEFLRQQVRMFMSQQLSGLSGNFLGNLGSVFSSLRGFIGISGSDAGNAIDTSAPSAEPMATGRNYVPYDGFKATLHKGDAVVPAPYNPANGAAGTGVALTQIVHIGHNVSASDVARAMQQAKAEAVATIYQSMRRNGVMASA